MRFPACALLALFLFLGGCSEEQLVLRFSHYLQSVDGELDPVYRKVILDALQAQQIERDSVDLELLGDGSSVGVSLPEPLTQVQRERLQSFFTQLLADRSGWAPELRLDIQSDKVDEQQIDAAGIPISAEIKAQIQAKAREMQPHYETRLALRDVNLAFHANAGGSEDYASKVLARCQVVAALSNPVPALGYKLVTPGFSAQAYDDFYTLFPLRIPSELSFADESLQRAVSEGRVSYSFQHSGLPKHAEHLRDQLVFDFGDVGEVMQLNGEAIGSLEEEQAKCEQRVAEVGRPFSFYYGKGLDRLVKVQFREPRS